MSDLARLLQQYGYGQLNALAQDGESYDTSNVLAGMPRTNPLSAALRTAMNAIPENKELPAPAFPLDPRSLSMANMVRGGLDTAASWLDYGNKPQPSDYKPSEMLAPLGAGLMGSAFAPQNAVGIFGGRLAKTADHNALAKAEEMAAKGADRKDIWDQTGWFQGADGKWRFEIDDSASKWLAPPPEDVKRGNVINMTADKALQHPAFYEAYPEAVARPVMYPKPEDARGMPVGSYNPDKDAFFVRAMDSEFGGPSAREVLLHEMQHRVQRDEGFEPGGRAANVIPGAYNRIAAEINDLLAPYAGNPPKEVRDEVARLRQSMKSIPEDPREAYRRLMGEVEARNVQSRMNMTQEQRRARPPWETEDVPRSDQIR